MCSFRVDGRPRALLDRGRPGVLPGSLVLVGDGHGVTAAVGHVLIDHEHWALILRTAEFLDLKESLLSPTAAARSGAPSVFMAFPLRKLLYKLSVIFYSPHPPKALSGTAAVMVCGSINL